jgi:predicted  nucleic acid-binding Zn-ribbon protein
MMLLAGALLGCGLLERVADCQSIVSRVNSGLATLSVQVPDAGQDPDAYETIAASYENLANDLEALSPRNAELKRSLGSYSDVLLRAAKHSRSYATELAKPERDSQKRQKRRRARLDRIRTLTKADVSRESSVVRKLNSVCHPK